MSDEAASVGRIAAIAKLARTVMLECGKMYGEREGGGADVNVVRLMVEWWRGW